MATTSINRSSHFLYNTIINRKARGPLTTIIDLRSSSSFEKNHIERSISLPVEELLSSTPELFDRKVDNVPKTVKVLVDLLRSFPKQTLMFCAEDVENANQLVLKVHFLISHQMPDFDKKDLKLLILSDPVSVFASKYGKLLCTGMNKGKVLKELKTFEKNKNTAYPNEVIEGFLFLGGIVHSRDSFTLQALNIRHILNLTAFSEQMFAPLNATAGTSDSTQMRLQISVTDLTNTDIKSKFKEAIEFIEKVRLNRQPDEKLLVHCAQGVSRSATVVIAYLMYTRDLPLNTAIQLVKQKRRQINPNFGFMRQLLKYEAELKLAKTKIESKEASSTAIQQQIQ